MIIVFYDGKCGLCSREINYYRRIAPNDLFDWQDITKSSSELKREGVSLSEGLRILHARDEDGYIHRGVDAFILIWTHLRFWSVLAIFVSLPIIKQIANFVYVRSANWRFKNLTHCQNAMKNDYKEP